MMSTDRDWVKRMHGVVRWTLAALFVAHGSIHSLGFVWAFDLAEVSEIGGPSLLIPHAEPGDAALVAFGMLWLASMLAFFGAGWAVAAGSRWWPRLAGVAAGISMVPTIAWWDDAWRGALISLSILALAALAGVRPMAGQADSRAVVEVPVPDGPGVGGGGW